MSLLHPLCLLNCVFVKITVLASFDVWAAGCLGALGGSPLFLAQLEFPAAILLHFYSRCLCFLILKSACLLLRLDLGRQNHDSNLVKFDSGVLGCVLPV